MPRPRAAPRPPRGRWGRPSPRAGCVRRRSPCPRHPDDGAHRDLARSGLGGERERATQRVSSSARTGRLMPSA
jgi:hypothetical protein